jgi:hypothetical protein
VYASTKPVVAISTSAKRSEVIVIGRSLCPHRVLCALDLDGDR